MIIKIKEVKRTELSKMWEQHYFYLFNLFGTKHSFFTWHGWNKFAMKDEWDIEQILELRKKQLRNKYKKKLNTRRDAIIFKGIKNE